MKETHLSNIFWVTIILFASSLSIAAQCKNVDKRYLTQKGDYLAPELREKVETLKQEVLLVPTNEHNAKQRARILWDWANAFSLKGGQFSIDVPLVCGVVLSFPPNEEYHLGEYKLIDRFVHELLVQEENPDAIGTLSTNVKGPFPIESYQIIKHTYTVGNMPMVPGGSVLVSWEIHSDIGETTQAKSSEDDNALLKATVPGEPLQGNDPKANNYVSISCSNPDAKFAVTSTEVTGTHGNFFNPGPRLTFQLQDATLTKGDTITLTYGDSSGGSRGLRVQSYVTDSFQLPVYVDLEGKGQFFSLPVLSYPLTGGPVARVRVMNPSIVKTGEAFELCIRSEDKYYNRAGSPAPGYEVLLNGKLAARIPESDETLSIIPDLKLDQPGVYRFTVRSIDGKITATSNPVWAKENPEYRIYWGDTHGHTEMSDAQGTPEGYWKHGRDEARLDFAALSEHDLWMTDNEWLEMIELVRKYTKEGKFIAYLGHEWTMKAAKGGHHNVYFRTPENRKPARLQDVPTLSILYQTLTTENNINDVLIIPHVHEPGDYRMIHPQMERLVEIMSIHGRHEWYGRKFLQQGHRVGFIASADEHLAHPGLGSPIYSTDLGGLAAVLAPAKTADGIFDAMRNRATYATTGERIILDFMVNDAYMGQNINLPKQCKINARVYATAPIDTIRLIKNGKDIWQKQYIDDPTSNLLEVRFWSSSDPVIYDSPRGGRVWEGTAKINGAKLKSIKTLSLTNPRSEWAQIDSEDSNQIYFKLFTRGSEKSVILELQDCQDEATINVNLCPTEEVCTTRPNLRAPMGFNAESFCLNINDIVSGCAEHKIKAGEFTDNVSLRRINLDAPLDATFTYVDPDAPNYYDYYYLHVRQLNGHEAWSSPIWVGGLESH